MDKQALDGFLIMFLFMLLFAVMIGSPRIRLPNLRFVATLLAVGFLIFLIWKFFVLGQA